MEFQISSPDKDSGLRQKIVEVLKRSEIFLGQDDSALVKIAVLPSSSCQTFNAGTIIFRQGQMAKFMYILDTGKVNLAMEIPGTKEEPPKTVMVDIITKGGLFGWSAIVPPFIYTKTAICEVTAAIVSISGPELKKLFEREPDIGYKAMQDFSHIIAWRLRELENVLITTKRSPIF